MSTDFMVVGNWKMNIPEEGVVEWCRSLGVWCEGRPRGLEVGIGAPYGELSFVSGEFGGREEVFVLGQDVSVWRGGSYTGEVSAKMLKLWGCDGVLVGHSERRHVLGEGDEQVYEKLRRVREEGMVSVLCVGETLEERERGEAYGRVSSQLHSAWGHDGGVGSDFLVVAYEPVWSIGTGRVPSEEDVREMIDHVETHLEVLMGEEEAGKVKILYGGSVNGGNAFALGGIEGIDGFLVGGASLSFERFLPILESINSGEMGE